MSLSTYTVNLLIAVLATLLCIIAARPATDHPCYRTCLKGKTMKCEFNFTIENYYSLGRTCNSCPLNITDCNLAGCIPVDGTHRSIIVVNRLFPGPSVEVCLGDQIVAHVNNQLISDATTVHWHGQHQRYTPYMDGLGFVTQCPIQPSNTFTYRFQATQKGTHFWHSHSGLQRGEGLYGALVIREPRQTNPHIKLYDFDLSEHVFILQDWTVLNGLDKYLEFTLSSGNNRPDTILVNGKGRNVEFIGDDGETVYTPLERFVVTKGFRYRFRVINNGLLNCPVETSVDNHTLTVISFDSFDINPIQAESIITNAGERYDIIINAKEEEGVYWIRFKGLHDCEANGVYQVAVLQYSTLSENDLPDAPISYELSHKDGVQINALNIGLESTNPETLSIAHLNSVAKLDRDLRGKPDFQFVIGLTLGRFGPQMNGISFQPPTSPILPARLSDDVFCNETTLANSNCTSQLCKCVHVVHLPYNALIEVILFDTSNGITHPIHLHGNSFRVMGMENLGGTVNATRIKSLDQQGLLRRDFHNPPIKDVIMVPGPGYVIIRFFSYNPGYWFIHCHLEYHTVAGMGLVFKVGKDRDMVPVPKNFPKCGDYDIKYPKHTSKFIH